MILVHGDHGARRVGLAFVLVLVVFWRLLVSGFGLGVGRDRA